jgi:SOR/SNZ family
VIPCDAAESASLVEHYCRRVRDRRFDDGALGAELAQASSATGTWTVKKSLAQMLKGGVIVDIVTPEQAMIVLGLRNDGPARVPAEVQPARSK